MARLVLPWRLELKKPEGSSNVAPLTKVIFTTFLYVSPVQIIPARDHTGTPLHFHPPPPRGAALNIASARRVNRATTRLLRAFPLRSALIVDDE